MGVFEIEVYVNVVPNLEVIYFKTPFIKSGIVVKINKNE